MSLFKLMFGFIVNIFLTNKSEADVTSYKFNPGKIIMILVLLLSLSFNSLFISKGTKLFDKMKKACPTITI